MATTYTERGFASAEATGTIAEAAGGIAVMVLAIIGLARAEAAPLTSIGILVLGAALLAEGTAVAGEYMQAIKDTSATRVDVQAGTGMTMEIFIGGAVLVLGILSLIGVSATSLAPVAVIAAGALMLVSAPTMLQLNEIRRQSDGVSEQAQSLMRASAASVSGIQILTGLTAIVLGILALATGGTAVAGVASTGQEAAHLTLVALLVLGAALTFNGTALTGSVMRMINR